MRLLVAGILIVANAAAAQTVQDLADEAEAMRAEMLALYPEHRGDGPPWLMDAVADALADAEAAAEEARRAFFADRGEPGPDRLLVSGLIEDMLTPQGGGFHGYWSDELPTLDSTAARQLAERVRDAVIASRFEKRLTDAITLPVRTDRAAKDRMDRSGECYRAAQLVGALMRESWANGDRDAAGERSVQLAKLANALEADAHMVSSLHGESAWMIYWGWLRGRLAAADLEVTDAQTHLRLVQARLTLNAASIATRYISIYLIELNDYPDKVKHMSADDLKQYRDLVMTLRERMRKSIDADPTYRLEHREQAGNEWFAMSSAIDDSSAREFDHAGGYNAFVSIENRRLNYCRALEVAIAIRLFELDHDSLPDSLDALVPEYLDAVPIDAFCGEPLRYEPGEEGRYVVYSVGWDGVDNDGRTHPEHNQRASQAPGSFFGEFRDPTGYDHRLDPWAPD